MTLEVPLWQEWVEEYRAEKSPKVRHPGIEGRCTVEIGKLLGVQPALISVQVLKVQRHALEDCLRSPVSPLLPRPWIIFPDSRSIS